MPFDGGNFKENAIFVLLSELSDRLRDRRYPYGFVWDYSHYSSCALSLIGNVYGSSSHLRNKLESSMGISVFRDIFFRGDESGHSDHVTPDIVADRIDRFLAARFQ